mmetsp:Transcript_8451/g.15447  ORF Transcript_8451/g.15447 Transcript_8451/m.15447 type:complete len:86 (+) Transcript_8451:251-508(+)
MYHQSNESREEWYHLVHKLCFLRAVLFVVFRSSSVFIVSRPLRSGAKLTVVALFIHALSYIACGNVYLHQYAIWSPMKRSCHCPV